jgi:hypothetical protein
MGMNYYLTLKTPIEIPHNELWELQPPRLHIGKSSYGWTFALHVYPDSETRPKGLQEWKELFSNPDFCIVDEEGRQVSEREMLNVILDRDYRDRLLVDNILCIGYGDGSYDLCISPQEVW